MDAELVIKQFKTDIESYTGGVNIHQGTVVGVMKKYCRSDSDYRLALKALTGKTSSKQLSESEWYALFLFVKPYKPENQKWQSGRDDMTEIINALVNSTVDQAGQESFLKLVEDAVKEISEISGVPQSFLKTKRMTQSEYEESYLNEWVDPEEPK